MLGAVLHAINTRLDAAVIAFQLDHAELKVVIVDREFSAVMAEALKRAKAKPLVVDFDDPEFPADAPAKKGERIGSLDYEALIAEGDPDFSWRMPDDEWDAISLNYTSGTTGNPKGVVYHHRGAALMCYANALAGSMARHPVYLWTLPMFHCNGWCFPWSISAVAGTHVCLRWVRAKPIYDAIAEHGVTHLCGAPIVMATLVNAAESDKRAFRAEGAVHDRRRAAAGGGARRDGDGRLRGDARLRADRDLRPGGGQRVERRMGRARRRRPGGEKGAAGRALSGARGAFGARPGDDAARAGRRRDARRGLLPRQHRHEGLSEESRRRPRRH